MAAGREQWLARPGAGVTYAVTFGMIGRHPLVAYVLSAGLVAVAAELLRSLLGYVHVPKDLALATAIVWVVLPNHGSLLYWPSAANIALALVLLLAGLRSGSRVAQPALLAASVLCYEATLPAAVLGLLIVPRVSSGRWQWRPLLRAAPFLVAATVWMVVNIHPAKRDLRASADLSLMLPAHFGWGVFSWRPLANVAGVAFCVAAAMVLARRRPLGVEGWLLAAGLVTIVVGTLPFVRYFYQPLGAGDRVNVVAALGAAMAWTAVLGLAVRRVPVTAVAIVAVLSVAALAEQWDAVQAWHRAAGDAREVMRRLDAGQTEIVRPPIRRNVAGVLDASTLDAAVDLSAGSRSARAQWSDLVGHDARDAGQ